MHSNKDDCRKCIPIKSGRRNEITGDDILIIPPCICDRQENFYKKISKFGAQNQYEKSTFNSYLGYSHSTKKAKQVCIDYLNYAKLTPPSSLAIMGGIGTGKTHLMWAVCRQIVNLGLSVEYIRYVDLISAYQGRYNNPDHYNKLIESIAGASALFIDDLFKGGNRNIATIKEDHIQLVYNIIDRCYYQSKLLVFTSEFSFEGLEGIDVAITSRLSDMVSYHNKNFALMIEDKNYRYLDKKPEKEIA